MKLRHNSEQPLLIKDILQGSCQNSCSYIPSDLIVIVPKYSSSTPSPNKNIPGSCNSRKCLWKTSSQCLNFSHTSGISDSIPVANTTTSSSCGCKESWAVWFPGRLTFTIHRCPGKHFPGFPTPEALLFKCPRYHRGREPCIEMFSSLRASAGYIWGEDEHGCSARWLMALGWTFYEQSPKFHWSSRLGIVIFNLNVENPGL